MQTTATFRLFGDLRLTAAAVTRRLGIQPTRAMEETLHRLLALPGDLWLDVCGDGFDDEEEQGNDG